MREIEQIKTDKLAGKFRKYIDYIRYPKFKNLIKNSRIDFNFPITVLVGVNGSGKSTVLKSLYGCVEGKVISDFWFSTSVDPIIEGDGDKNCFIYNYATEIHEEKDFEVLCTRTRREKNPDYWETSKPLLKYSMKRKNNDSNYRRKKIENKLLYIDFHSLLSAFDKYRYFLNNERITEANNYLRRKSTTLKTIIRNNQIVELGSNPKPQNTLPKRLTPQALEEASIILGKRYTEAIILKHKLFKIWGNSIFFTTEHNGTYSEAFAGSGENTVLNIVHTIHNVDNYTLVLLDEPESCLHPGAQKRLFEFIVKQCLRKKLQIVISTHSKEFVYRLPKNAIKVFYELPDGQIEIKNECNAESAFFHIGEDIANKKLIFTEDRLGKLILDRTVNKLGPEYQNQIETIIHPSGESEMKKSIARYSKFRELNKFIVFDGDVKLDSQNMEIEIVDVNTILSGDMTSEYLGEIIKKQTKVENPKSLFLFNSNESEQNKLNDYKQYLDFYSKNVLFLPKRTPEEMIWDDEIAKSISEALGANDVIETISQEANYKTKFEILSMALKGDSSSDTIYDTQMLFITKFLNSENADFQEVINILKSIISS